MYLKQIIFLAIVFLTLGCQPKAQSEHIDVVNVETFEQEIHKSNVQLVDVRTVKEFDAGHIEGATNIDVLQDNLFKTEIESLDKSQPVAVYCKSGKRSNKAAQILEEAGFTEIIDLDSGYLGWEKAKQENN